MAREYKLIDSVAYPPSMKIPKDPLLSKVFGDTKFEGETVEQMVARMDECAIEASIITVNAATREPFQPYRVGQKIDDTALDAACKDVADMMARYPGRFFGCVAVDPTGMMKAVRRARAGGPRIRIHVCFILPAAIGLPPNHACYFPIYAKCVELGIPVRMNVGLPAFQGAGWVQHPMHLDEVLLAFPELTVVGAMSAIPGMWSASPCCKNIQIFICSLPDGCRNAFPRSCGNSPIREALISLCGRVTIRCCPWTAPPGRAGSAAQGGGQAPLPPR